MNWYLLDTSFLGMEIIRRGVCLGWESSQHSRALQQQEGERKTPVRLCGKPAGRKHSSSQLRVVFTSTGAEGEMGHVRNAGKKRRSAGAAGYEEREGTPELATRPRPSQREKTKSKLSWKYLFTSYLSGFGTKQVLAWVLHVTPTSSLPSWHKSSENWKWNPSKWSAAPKKSSRGTPHALCIIGRNRNPTVPKAGPAPRNSCLF